MCVVFVKNKRNTKTEQTFGPSPLSCPAADPHPGLSYPVGRPVLSHLATIPSQMPLRRVVSHSETISALSQYETLGTHLEAVYGPYSTSAPSTKHSTIEARQDTKCHGD